MMIKKRGYLKPNLNKNLINVFTLSLRLAKKPYKPTVAKNSSNF